MNCRALLLFSVLLGMSTVAATEPNIHDTRLLADPAVSSERVAFIDANDLWTADLDAGLYGRQ